MPEPTSLHKDAILSNMSVQYKNDTLIWPQVMPLVKVNKRSDAYYVYTKADSYTIPDDFLGPKSLPNEYDWGVSEGNYSVKDHGLGDWLPQAVIDNADNPLRAEIDTNDYLNRLLELAQEQRVATVIFTAANYPTGNKVTLAGDDQWSGSTDDPIDDVQTAIDACFQRANTLVFGLETWQVFRKLPEILDAVKSATRFQSSGGLATQSEVASLFDVERVLIGRARYNTAKEGQTASYSRLWGKHMAALYVEPNPGIRSIAFGVTFAESFKMTSRDFDPKRGIKGAHFIKVAWNSDEKVIASDVGYLITDAVA